MDTNHPPAFCILRTKKRKSLAGVRGVCRHHFRRVAVRGADPERSHRNKFFGPGEDASEYIQYRVSQAEERNGRRFRRGSVKAVEYMLTASPEWWNRVSHDERKRFFIRARQWLRDVHGAVNIVGEWVHLDEKSPHLHALVIPFVDGEKRLSAKHFLGGAAKLSDLQDSYAQALAPLGLQRGIKGSKATHFPVREYWKAIDSPIAPKPSRWDYARAAVGLLSPALDIREKQAQAHRASVVVMQRQRARAIQVAAASEAQKRKSHDLAAEARELKLGWEQLHSRARGVDVLASKGSVLVHYSGAGYGSSSEPSL